MSEVNVDDELQVREYPSFSHLIERRHQPRDDSAARLRKPASRRLQLRRRLLLLSFVAPFASTSPPTNITQQQHYPSRCHHQNTFFNCHFLARVNSSTVPTLI